MSQTPAYTWIGYFTVVVPFSTASQWHAKETTGPFSVLTRGRFETEAEAHAWAKEHLNGGPYEVRGQEFHP